MKSSRHHYIPQFLLKGFKNKEGLMYIYDKQQDKILDNPRPPKSVFFEKNMNKAKISEEIETSLIEDLLYKEIDNLSSRIIKKYQEKKIEELDFTSQEQGVFLVFLIALFWRIPFTDSVVKDILEQSTISWLNIDPTILKKDEMFSKLFRVGLLNWTIDEMAKSNTKDSKMLNIHQFHHDIFIISDNPILFKKKPSSFSEFNDFDFMIALSSKRIYTSTYSKLEPFSLINVIHYNTCVIEQSVRYAGCCSREILSESVLSYKKVKNYGIEKIILEKAFEKN